ncbi:hypothetical protein scyTo_0000624 [Scyliorhinus torazame]|uniref:Uncharacterized protein n=1 Tax=Scyliorhinus torazame TaxID=75743 RepID=A0A401P0L7_SCYTO|nr:hypothetical protein [Scyliorhinus torazame]
MLASCFFIGFVRAGSVDPEDAEALGGDSSWGEEQGHEDPKDESSLLRLQLKEKDELISQLQDKLDRSQSVQRAHSSQADKTTQTELLGHDNSEKETQGKAIDS